MVISPRIVYSHHYNIGFPGLQWFHPFDGRKYGRAWRELHRRFGNELLNCWIKPKIPVGRAELLRIHSERYIEQLADRKFVAAVVEIPQLRSLPAWMIDGLILRPMRWAVRGTMLATQAALDHGIAVNLAGGYHHASPDNGHGFSAYADVGLAVEELRRSNRLGEGDKIVYVDLDAHQGNGVCRTFFDDRRVFIYDQYNAFNFPFDQRAQRRIDCDVQLATGCHQADYLDALRKKLPTFLDAINRNSDIKLAIYNAGTDIYMGDKLGGMNVSADGILLRDKFVLNELVSRQLPTAIVLSGGYSRESYHFVAEMAAYVLEKWGRKPTG